MAVPGITSQFDREHLAIIPEEISALLFICHVPSLTHFIFQLPSFYNSFVQLGAGGNLICLCSCKKQGIRLAHIIGPCNLPGFKIVPSKWRHLQILVQTQLIIPRVPGTLRDFEKNPIGSPPVGPPSLASLSAAAILAAGGSKRTVKSYRPGLANKSYTVNKVDLYLLSDQDEEFYSCTHGWHNWDRVQQNKHMSQK